MVCVVVAVGAGFTYGLKVMLVNNGCMLIRYVSVSGEVSSMEKCVVEDSFYDFEYKICINEE